MSRLRFLFLTAFAALAGVCFAAPMTVKEVDFLVRMKTPEAEILRELTGRRLIAPLDAAGEQQLPASGASAGLIAQIKSGAYTMNPQQAQAEMQRQAAAQQAREAQANAPAGRPKAAARSSGGGTTRSWLQDRLFHLDGDTLKPLDPVKIAPTRVFALYGSASWCGPCKKFTPKLVAAYHNLKGKYPEFEVIFVSSDRDEFNMAEYMRTYKMPWPAIKPKQLPLEMNGFFGDSIPWLALIGEDGRPLTQNAIDKKYIGPERILGTLDDFLAQRRTQGL